MPDLFKTVSHRAREGGRGSGSPLEMRDRMIGAAMQLQNEIKEAKQRERADAAPRASWWRRLLRREGPVKRKAPEERR